MPAYRFSWDAFDDDTVRELARARGHVGEAHAAREWLSQHAKRPDEEFVRETKDVLARVWLPRYAGATQLADHLIEWRIGPLGRPPSTLAEGAAYVDRCRNTRGVRRLLVDAMVRFGDRDRNDEGELGPDFVPRFASIRPAQQPDNSRSAYPYQREAWTRLSGALALAEASGTFRGLLVMPTGSGKTFTAVSWLLENVVNQRRRILWLAHRHELLNQAAREFHAQARLAAPRELLRIRLVSQAHCRAHQIDPADDIILASMDLLARNTDLAERLLRDERLFLVIDEAHHAPARSYRRLIETLRGTGDHRILGLTATPTRTQEAERPVLSRLFGEKPLVEVSTRELIEQGYLARPIPVRVSTGVAIESDATQKDIDHLATFGELSEPWLARIGELAQRNDAVVRHYLDHRDEYGKTLVFAINVAHAALLTERFREAGVEAEYVASYRPDASHADTSDVLQRFRDRSSGLDVVVNVQMLTEGVDIPVVRTVFLTRPTQSEILLRQMVGRALRGRAAGGNDKAYLVSFEDHWQKFTDWQNQLALVPDVVPPAELASADPEQPPTPEQTDELERLAGVLPWEVIRAAATAIRQRGIDTQADAFEAVPHGWYLLERTVDGEPVRQIIAVHAHQEPAWRAFIDKLSALGAKLDHVVVEDQYREYFDDCFPVLPAKLDAHAMLEHFRAGAEPPEYHALETRRACDPYEVAAEVAKSDLRESEKAALLSERYSRLAQAIYPTLRDFRAAVDDALHELRHPSEATRRTAGTPIFEPRPDQPLRPGPHHDLGALLREVIERAPTLLGGPVVHQGPISWTRRPIKGYFAMANWAPEAKPGHGEIRVNCVLDSPDIDADTLRFLLWHEFLHLHLRAGHDKVFRELERRWTNWPEHDRKLDGLHEHYAVQYW